jgi:hypothetical protein
MKGCPVEAGLYEKPPATRFPPIPARRGSQGALAAYCPLSTSPALKRPSAPARRIVSAPVFHQGSFFRLSGPFVADAGLAPIRKLC